MLSTPLDLTARRLFITVCAALGLAGLSIAAVAENADSQASLGGPVYVSLEPEFTVNYGQGGRLRYLKAAVSLAVPDDQAALEVNTHSDAIRHEIIMMISEQSGDEIRSAQSRREMQQELLERIRDFMEEETGAPQVQNVLFTSFIVQG